MRLKCHHSWYGVLLSINLRIAEMAAVEDAPPPRLVSGGRYVEMTWSDTRIVKFMKAQTVRLGLPILSRKWDIVDDSYESRTEWGRRKAVLVREMLSSGMKGKDVAAELGVSQAYVSEVKHRKGSH